MTNGYQKGDRTQATCPLCQKKQSRIYRIGIREDPTYPVQECTFCGLVFIENRIPDLREYYRSAYRLQHEHIPGAVLTPQQRFPLQRDFARVSAQRFSEQVPVGSSVLEIGCSAGGFLSHLVQKGYDCYGCEWNDEDAEFVRKVGEVPCEEGSIDEVFPGKTFTAIAAIAVLEHVADPMAFLRSCRERLIGGGWLYLETPNLRDALLSMYDLESFAKWYFREPHITYWKTETIAALLNTTGFEAHINWYQRYALHNHVNWILNGIPMQDPQMARKIMLPVPKTHPAAAALNRIWDQIEQEYRIQCETLFCADTLTVMGRRIQI